ncbi:hypothetical protein Scep_007036 [Stephania cephalantha]|uniref:Uncharacterized protein n=1 Tax=Stephania cephalantha TaxID=152367 RepID=A0AAP0KB46_9MAGN
MSITLEDVSMLLHIPVVGKVVAVENLSRYIEESRMEAIKIVFNLFGVGIDEAKEEVNYTRGLMV